MHRLYLQIYAALLAILAVLFVLIALAVWRFDPNDEAERWIGDLERFADTVIPPATAPTEDVARVVRAFADPLELDLVFFDASGTELFRLGDPSRALPPGDESRFIHERGYRGHRMLLLVLHDGRRLLIDGHRDGAGRPLTHLVGVIALLGLATAIVALPVARRLTRRLETLKHHVDEFGTDGLDARAPVEGRDEIAQLASSFNATADRIEALVSDKSRLLANTSHELRTPLTRVRMALELLREGARPELLDRMDRDIEELDDLIGELLVASRLDAPEHRVEREPVDLLALIAEEASRRDGVTVNGDPVQIEGDPRLLRRLIRNLIENALRHGEPPVDIELARNLQADHARVIVSDRGAGVPRSERERIFDPFYRPDGEASAEGGLGLGLALVRQIAERHDGQIHCEAREGGGTRFVLDLPLP